MHKLDRSAVPTPNCLDERPEGYYRLTARQKEEIRRALLIIQGQRCAYCERRTGDGPNDGHIEHFRNQAGHPQLQVAWENMYWSCRDEDTCGKHKDKCERYSGDLRRFDPADIIDPATEDPERFLHFFSDGRVRPREGLSDADRHRAEETIRVFHLDDSPLLRRAREDAVKPYIGSIETLMNAAPEWVVPYIQTELCKVVTMPFSTAVKSYLESVIKT